MQHYLVSYAINNGFGRSFISTNGPVNSDRIGEWERELAKRNGVDRVAVIFFAKIDEPDQPESH